MPVLYALAHLLNAFCIARVVKCPPVLLDNNKGISGSVDSPICCFHVKNSLHCFLKEPLTKTLRFFLPFPCTTTSDGMVNGVRFWFLPARNLSHSTGSSSNIRQTCLLRKKSGCQLPVDILRIGDGKSGTALIGLVTSSSLDSIHLGFNLAQQFVGN